MDTLQSRQSETRTTLAPSNGWTPADLPELSTKGLPFARPFVLEETKQPVRQSRTVPGAATPFGFSFRKWPEPGEGSSLNLDGAFYDPQAQVNVLPEPALFYVSTTTERTEKKWTSGYIPCVTFTCFDSFGKYDTFYDPSTDREADFEPD